MVKAKTTRSSKIKTEPEEEDVKKQAKAKGLHKVFLLPEEILEEPKELRFERFYCPAKDGATLFLTRSEEPKQFRQVVEFAEPRRSWLLNSDVCSDGRFFMALPVDLTFMALHHLRKHCTQKAIALDNIFDEKDESVSRLLMDFVQPERLACVADVKKAGGTNYYKYNAKKTLAWLALKTRRISSVLKSTAVHCGQSALSQNYTRSEAAADELVDEMDYLRMACDIVGESIDMDLHEELVRYLEIPQEPLVSAKGEANAAGKRKSLKALNGAENKKIKLDSPAEKLKNSSLLDESVEDSTSPPAAETKFVPLKEKVLTAKEKAFAKGAKGTKSIASFFKK